MKKVMNVGVFLLFTYPAGLLIGGVLGLLRVAGFLEIKGWENFPRQKGKILLVSNHPYKGEQFLLTGLFLGQYLLRPLKYGPYTIADAKNYYNNPLWWFLRPRLIPVDRTRGDGRNPRSLLVARKILKSGGNVITFPEGGRTNKKGEIQLVSRGGNKIRQLKGGFSILAAEIGVITVPVWCKFYSWKRIKFTIGEPICFVGKPREEKEVVSKMKDILLKLADAN